MQAAPSLSARRAWIEIQLRRFCLCGGKASLSARRAWIEIQMTICDFYRACRRSPQGERG